MSNTFYFQDSDVFSDMEEETNDFIEVHKNIAQRRAYLHVCINNIGWSGGHK